MTFKHETDIKSKKGYLFHCTTLLLLEPWLLVPANKYKLPAAVRKLLLYILLTS